MQKNKKCNSNHKSVENTSVRDSRLNGNIIRRRRKCNSCGINIYTEEKVIGFGSTPWGRPRAAKKTKGKELSSRGKRILVSRAKDEELERENAKLAPREPTTFVELDLDDMSDEELEAWIFSQ